jgi:L-arabinose isomerase
MEASDDQLKVGLFGIGLDSYWPQFPGLRDTLIGFTAQVARQLESCGVRVVNLGLITTPEKSFAAGHEFRKADVDLIFIICRDLRPFLDRASRGAPGQSSSHHSQFVSGASD